MKADLRLAQRRLNQLQHWIRHTLDGAESCHHEGTISNQALHDMRAQLELLERQAKSQLKQSLEASFFREQ